MEILGSGLLLELAVLAVVLGKVVACDAAQVGGSLGAELAAHADILFTLY